MKGVVLIALATGFALNLALFLANIERVLTALTVANGIAVVGCAAAAALLVGRAE